MEGRNTPYDHQLSSISTDSPKIRSNAEKVDRYFIKFDDARGYPYLINSKVPWFQV